MKEQEKITCPKCGMEVAIHKDGTLYAHGKFRKDGRTDLFPVIWCVMSDKPAKEEVKS